MGFDEHGNKIKSSGEDGFVMINFSNLKDGWSNVGDAPDAPVDNSGFSNGVSGNAGKTWAERVKGLPKADETIEPSSGASPHGINRIAAIGLEGDALRRKKLVMDRVEHIEIGTEALEFITSKNKPPFEAPEIFDIADFLGRPVDPTLYKVDQLWPSGGNVLFAAAAKFGKSTVIMNLIRALLDGSAFLGTFTVARIPDGESLLLIDLEMSESRVQSELIAQQIAHPSRLKVACLRGQPKRFDITDAETRAHMVDYCLRHNVRTLILDPLAPMLGYLNVDENDNTTVNRFFQQLDEFKKEAGIRDLIVTHHCGHSADMRPRGASRFNDWPDALWLAKIDGDVTDPNTPRKFFARGRDVGESFQSSATISRDLGNPKRLLIDMATAAVADSTNDIMNGIRTSLTLNPGGLRLDGSVVKATTLMAELLVQEQAGAIPMMPTKDRVSGLLTQMITSGEITSREVTSPGASGKVTVYKLS